MRKEKLIALAAAYVMAVGIVNTKAQPSVQLNFGPGSPVSPNTMVMAPTMPPPLWGPAVPMSPRRGVVYAPGTWAWHGAAWVWVPGAWVAPPGPGARWAPGQWDRDRRRGGSRWVGGRWRR